MPSQTTHILHRKLDEFIRKYYRNELLRGAVLSVGLSLLAWFLVSLLEYLGRFDPLTRQVLFFVYFALVLSVILRYLLRPVLGFLAIGRHMDHFQAARVIGKHFPEVSDKLLNLLQLDALDHPDSALLAASIAQKTQELQPIPFIQAIDVRTTLRYLRFAVLPSLLILAVLILSPGFKGSTDRMLHYKRHYATPAPFRFIPDADHYRITQGQQLPVQLRMEGEVLPQEVYLSLDGMRYKMQQLDAAHFQFDVPALQRSTQFHFEAGTFASPPYPVEVLLKPTLLSFKARMQFPAYLKQAPEEVSSIGELTIPEGTHIQWTFDTRNTDRIRIHTSRDSFLRGNTYDQRFLHSQEVGVYTSNDRMEGDSLHYRIRVVPDAYPEIQAQALQDSNSVGLLYFTGSIGDDHGFTRLEFEYTHRHGTELRTERIPLVMDPEVRQQTFYHLLDMKALGLQLEDELSYRFLVWDNDGVNGAKQSSTQKMYYRAPSAGELQEHVQHENEQIKEDLDQREAESKQLQEDIEEVERMLTEKKQLDWNDQQKINDLLQRHEQLQQQIQQTIDRQLRKNQLENEFKPPSEQLLNKQQRLQELFEQVIDPETRELMEKIRQLMEENRPEELQKAMEQLKFSEEDMNKELDRMLELFKELELEKQLEETIQQLSELARRERELSEESKEGKTPQDELLQKQQAVEAEFKQLQEQFQQIQEKNDALESPKDISVPEAPQQTIQQQMDQAEENLQKGKSGKAAGHQQQAAEELEKMAQDLEQQKDEAYEEQQEEDYQALRQLLENIVQLSFDQEALQDQFKVNRNYSPKYVELRQQQRKLMDDTRLVEDSLLALSKRVIQLEDFITDEIGEVKHRLQYSLEELGERRTKEAMVHQQYAMTGYNNLALMLSQSLLNMQEDMAGQSESKGKPKANCKKAGSSGKKGKKPNAGAIRQLQQELARQMQQLQEGKKNGNQPSSQQFAEMAAKQAAIRKMMQDLQQQLNKEGRGGDLGDLQHTQDLMDQMEKDLYFKHLDQNTIERMRQIEIQLSEHEKAEDEREQDEQRKSDQGRDIKREFPPDLQEYLEEKARELEQLRKLSPELRPYYRKKVEDYFEQP